MTDSNGIGFTPLATLPQNKTVELKKVWAHPTSDGFIELFYRYDHDTAEAWWILKYPYGVVSMHPDGKHKHSYDFWKQSVEGT